MRFPSTARRVEETHFEDGNGEALLLEEAGEQLGQVVEGAAGKVGQLLELIPQAELERHLSHTHAYLLPRKNNSYKCVP